MFVGSDAKMFHFWIHTSFIESNYICLEKAVLDKACKDTKNKHFGEAFKIELFMELVEDVPDAEESGGGLAVGAEEDKDAEEEEEDDGDD